MLLLDLIMVVILKGLLAYMLTATSLLVAKHWKAQEKVTLSDWVVKIRDMF